MPPKRRSIAHGSPVLKKAKIEHSEEDLKSFLLSTLQLVTNLRDDNNRILCKEFFKLPSKKLYPDYYELINEPISINEIKGKVVNNKYKSGAEFLNDFKLMNKNAKTYNDASSMIALDCDFILNFVEDQVKQFDGEDTGNPIVKEEPLEEKNYLPLLKTLLYQCINYKPYKRNKISPPFMDIVDGEMYPDYYTIIEKGMSFNYLLQNISDYSNDLPKFLKDINLIWSNAQTYNDESSLLYQDSLKLCEYFYKKFAEFLEKENIILEYEIPQPVVTEKIEVKEESQPLERRKRGRPRLEDTVLEDPPPIEFLDDDDEDEPEDEIVKEEEPEINEDETKIEEPLPLSLSMKPENGLNKFLGYKKYISKPTNDLFKNFIESITICSSRSMFKKTNLQTTKVGEFIADLEKLKPKNEKFFQPLSTEYFQYKLEQTDLSSTNYTLNLRNINSLQVDTLLNMLTIDTQKFEQVFFCNGERISASPSVYEIDENELNEPHRLSLSKFDINLLPGLNSLEFVVKVGPIISVDKNGKLPSRHATNPNNEKNYITERCCIWVTVDQF